MVVACSSGEEVYSLAITLLEFLGARASSLRIQIFGTDINGKGIATARAGVYPDSALKTVSAERISSFFTKTLGGYQVNKAVRDLCVFARQDVTRDPPFSNLDLAASNSGGQGENNWIRVAAPGDRIISAIPNGRYGAWSGTSMAAPVVAGVAALVKQRFKAQAPTVHDLAEHIEKTGVISILPSSQPVNVRTDAFLAVTRQLVIEDRSKSKIYRLKNKRP